MFQWTSDAPSDLSAYQRVARFEDEDGTGRIAILVPRARVRSHANALLPRFTMQQLTRLILTLALLVAAAALAQEPKVGVEKLAENVYRRFVTMSAPTRCIYA